MCTSTCQLGPGLTSVCGDGVIDTSLDSNSNPKEQCDDGSNNGSNQDCLSDCRTATCGDGFLHNQGSGNEQCDNGSGNSATEKDACRPTCLNAYCGDAVIDTGETCDMTAAGFSNCRSNCTRCGDGVVDPRNL